MGSKWFLVLAFAALLVVIVALFYVFSLPPKFLREDVGGKYQCRIEIIEKDPRGFEVGFVYYIKEGVEYKGGYDSSLKDALEWTKANTSENAVFLNWWDYGHMIVGYAERESVIKNPSEEALISVKDPSDYRELEPHEMIVDVAKALTTTDENETISIMNKYNAIHILVTVVDGAGKATWIFRFAGHNFTNYMNMSWYDTGRWSYTFDPNMYNELGKKTTIYKILTNAEIAGLTQVYSDENVTICRLLT